MDSILLVDDDELLRTSFENLLTEEGYAVKAVSSGEEALKVLENGKPDVVIMDICMAGIDGITTLRHIRETDLRLPVIMMTAYSTTSVAIEATKLGAFDYVLKPFDIPEVLGLIDKAVEAGRLMHKRVGLQEPADSASMDVLLGNSRVMHEVYKAIGRVAPTDAVVLLRGESGTGKELVSRAIYQHSMRSKAPFIVVNCVAIPDTLLESELFGYEKGAFTGANTKRIGKIEQASGGTVFLDEIGDMPLSIQGKLLRLLQENQIEPLGSRETINVDVRIVAATNRDLEKAVSEGRFREDLYYRLNVIALPLPPLRERLSDIPILANHFLRTLSMEMDIPTPVFEEEAFSRLSEYGWPGNVRELRNFVQKLLVFNRGEGIGLTDVQEALQDMALAGKEKSVQDDEMLTNYVKAQLASNSGEGCFDSIMDTLSSITVAMALERCGGNRSQAARLLGLSRPTLLAKMEKYNIQ